MIRDEAHDRVLGEITARRRVQWRERHGAVDLRNDPHEEIATFAWLRDHDAISALEYEAAVDEITAHHRPPVAGLPQAPTLRTH